MDPFVIGLVLMPVVFIGGTWLAIKLFDRAERAAIERVRRTGIPCIAFVKSYRRISVTQHRVLFEIRLPSGPIGREYALSGLSEAWLADAAALGRPVQVIAHPDAKTIALA
jgi:hypothetical protein